MSHFIKTFGRIRPSASDGVSALIATDKSVKIETENGQRSYDLHRIFKSDATQQDVFLCVAKRIVEDSADGFNGTIFAYGQTGSGKTHTMLGPSDSWSEPSKKGLIPRSVEYLFELLDAKTKECQKFTFSVDVEFVELYNEDIFDLLNMKNKVQLRDLGKDVQLVGTKAESVDNSLDLMHTVQRGWQSRSTGSTAMNNESSRSHALLIIKIKTVEVTGDLVKERFSTLNLVDLAGSERQSHTKASGDRLKEATNINSSLTVLGRCIRILSSPKPGQSYVPFRDSHLTHILKNSLGGNSKTAVIVNMHPDRDFLTETTSTLHFAQSCTLIKNVVTRNEVMTGDQENSYKKAIQELRKEVDEARAKAREEFEKKLEIAEQLQHRLTAENDSLKTENSDLRAKYKMALVKYVAGDGTEQSLEKIEKMFSIISLEESASLQTLQLEKEASEKKCHQLQQELNDLHDKYQQNLNTTLLMQTPDPKKRQSSSRPRRRETQYRASLSRLANQVDEEDVSERLQEADTMISKLESEKQSLESKLEAAKEKEYETERKHAESIAVLKREKTELEKDLAAAIDDISEYASKVKSNDETLTRLLTEITLLEKTKKDLEESKKEVEDKMSKEMDDLTQYYKSKESELQSQLETLSKANTASSESQKVRISGFEAEIESLKQQNEAIQQEMSANFATFREQITETELLIVTARKETSDSSETISQLERDLQAKSELVSRLEQTVQQKVEQLKNRADLVSTLEQEIVKKADLIAEQCARLDENAEALSNYYSVKRKLEESRENEQYMQKRLDDMKAQMQTQIENHHKDIKNVKAKKDDEIKSLKESLDLTSQSLKEEEARFKKHKSDENKKFEKKMADMEKHFKTAKAEALKKNEEKVRRESMHEMETSLLEKDNKIIELKGMKDYFENLHNEDTRLISEQLGCKQQRLSYVEKIRREKVEQEETIKQLRSEIARLSKGYREVNRPVLRSRNTADLPK